MTLDVPVNQGHVPPGSVACCLVGVTAVADGIAGHSPVQLWGVTSRDQFGSYV